MKEANEMNQEKNTEPETEEVEVRLPVKHSKRAIRVQFKNVHLLFLTMGRREKTDVLIRF